ncbi:hypothetical protein NQ315_002712 [Exocentrus adspersus]|uniref:Transposable element P transposase n=1 Tax=Exocentrus adspersus TaxID=1586481 RepID=A0AAV8VIS6_9CUCU|nr:hypothetical protein NQ315_002712 [Exocentrus adspersus]
MRFGIGNPDLLRLSPNTLNKTKSLCSNHFKDEDFLNLTRKRLKIGAIPKEYKENCDLPSNRSSPELTVMKPLRTYQRDIQNPVSQQDLPKELELEYIEINSPRNSPTIQFLTDITNMPESLPRSAPLPTNTSIENVTKLKKTIAKQRKVLKNKRSIIARLRKNAQKMKTESTVRKWIGAARIETGFRPELVYQIKKKVEAMEESERYCSVVFDEIKIKKSFDYSKLLDYIEGYEDLGPTFGRSSKRGSQIMLFLARGIYSKWKIPLGYFVSATAMKHNILENIITEMVTKIHETGLYIKTIVCDQDVKRVYEIDQLSKTGKSLLKLTPAHINPSIFEKMKCRLALQIFSNSVAATIRTCVETGELTSDTALNTADFIEYMNNIFDSMNSKSKFSRNPFNCALGVMSDMPRRHKHKLGTPYRRNYPQENMDRALVAVIDDHYLFKQAAEMHGVPKSTLYDIYRGFLCNI